MITACRVLVRFATGKYLKIILITLAITIRSGNENFNYYNVRIATLKYLSRISDKEYYINESRMILSAEKYDDDTF